MMADTHSLRSEAQQLMQGMLATTARFERAMTKEVPTPAVDDVIKPEATFVTKANFTVGNVMGGAPKKS